MTAALVEVVKLPRRPHLLGASMPAIDALPAVPQPPSEWDSFERNSTSAAHLHPVTECPDCGFLRMTFGSPHAPRFNASGALIDCAGRPL